MTAVLTVEGLALGFGGVTALAEVSLSVDAGERVALIGPNGAGKTSVLNCISGVERPSEGRITFEGRDLAGLSATRRAGLGIARTLQALAVVPELDVLSNLLLGWHRFGRAGVIGAALGLRRARAEEAAARDRCQQIAEELGLSELMHEQAGGLSLPVRKRLELGRALAMEPRLLLLDEPFAGAGADDLTLMTGAIRRVSEAGTAVLLVDHDVETVLGDLVQRVVVLDAGRVVSAGTPDDVQAQPAVLEAYLGRGRGSRPPVPAP